MARGAPQPSDPTRGWRTSSTRGHAALSVLVLLFQIFKFIYDFEKRFALPFGFSKQRRTLAMRCLRNVGYTRILPSTRCKRNGRKVGGMCSCLIWGDLDVSLFEFRLTIADLSIYIYERRK